VFFIYVLAGVVPPDAIGRVGLKSIYEEYFTEYCVVDPVTDPKYVQYVDLNRVTGQ
jgi:hypothetical protein